MAVSISTTVLMRGNKTRASRGGKRICVWHAKHNFATRKICFEFDAVVSNVEHSRTVNANHHGEAREMLVLNFSRCLTLTTL
jgi:hypothetical protein